MYVVDKVQTCKTSSTGIYKTTEAKEKPTAFTSFSGINHWKFML